MPAIWIPKRLVEISLINTAAQAPASFSSHCEIEYGSRIIAAAREAKASGSPIIMLTGPSASGKTTTANKISRALNKDGVHSVVVSLDDFYHNIENYPRLPDGRKDYENITALDVDEIHSCLTALIKNGEADFPEFDFKTESRMEHRKHIELNGGMLIIEGIHALNPILTDVLPENSVYKIYAGLREEYSCNGQRYLSTRDIRLARRMVRDFKFRGHGIEKTLDMWPMVCDGEDKFIKSFKSYADLLVDTSFSYEICVLAPIMEQMKGKIKDPALKGTLEDLIEKFELCTHIQAGYVPPKSMLREFIGS